MNNPIEKYCAYFISCWQQNDKQGMDEAVNGVYRAINSGPEMILDAYLEGVTPLVMMATEYNLGANAVKMAYYVISKLWFKTREQNDPQFFETVLGMGIAFILRNYDALNHILIAIEARIPFYHLDCQLQSFYSAYCENLSYSEKETLRQQIQECCHFGWQNKDTVDHITAISLAEFIESYESQLKEGDGIWSLSKKLGIDLDNL